MFVDQRSSSFSLKILLFMILLPFGLGCFNDNQHHQGRVTYVSLGQQLIDLKQALDTEAISTAEYQSAKKRVLEDRCFGQVNTGSEDESGGFFSFGDDN